MNNLDQAIETAAEVEPVGEVFDFNVSKEDRDDQKLPILYEKYKDLPVGTKLYTTPPAAVERKCSECGNGEPDLSLYCVRCLNNDGWTLDEPPAAVPDAWKPSGIEYDRAIHHNPDGRAWAELFMQTFPDCGADIDTMHGWFSNAIMSMYDHLSNRTTPPAARSQEQPQ